MTGAAARDREAIAEAAGIELDLEAFARFDGTELESAIADDDYAEYARAVAERERLEAYGPTGWWQ